VEINGEVISEDRVPSFEELENEMLKRKAGA
jgi:hypothetical protein